MTPKPQANRLDEKIEYDNDTNFVKASFYTDELELSPLADDLILIYE